MRAVNLLPREVARTKSRRLSTPAVVGIISGLVVLVVLAGGFVKESAEVAHKKTELDAARAELALVPAPVAPDMASSTLAAERTQRVASLQGALNGRVAWDRVLREIALVVPDDVWLSGLTLQTPDTATAVPTSGSTAAPTPATSSSPSDFTMNGKAFTHVGVARLLSRLALVPDLDNVTLGHSTAVKGGKRPSVEFQVLAGVRVPGVSQ
jgi:Tfp pilus assembly protein PilN